VIFCGIFSCTRFVWSQLHATWEFSCVAARGRHLFLLARARESVPPSAVTFRDAIPRRCRLRCRGLLANLGALAVEDRLVGADISHLLSKLP
jgi:hypothetical protein